MVSTPDSHSGDRGSSPRDGAFLPLLLVVALVLRRPVKSDRHRYTALSVALELRAALDYWYFGPAETCEE